MKWIKNNANVLCACMIVLNLLLGAFYSFSLHDKIAFLDEKEYLLIAENVAHKGMVSMNGNEPTAWRPPGYPFLLAGLIKLGAGMFVLHLANFVALSLSMWLVYLILRPYSVYAGLLGVLFIYLYPVLFYAAGTLYPQTIAATISLFCTWLLFQYRNRLSGTLSAVIGFLYGFSILMIPTSLVNLIVTALWAMKRPIWKNSLLMFVCAGLVLVPWIVRNYMVYDAFVPVATNSGLNLLIGNSIKTKPNSGVTVDLSAYDPHRELNEIEADHYYRDKAVAYIKENKTQALKLYMLKFLNYFNFSNDFATAAEITSARVWLLFISYGFILTLTIMRILWAFFIPLNRLEWFIIALYIMSGLMAAVFFTRIRFRLPYDVYLIMLNALFVSYFLTAKDKEPEEA